MLESQARSESSRPPPAGEPAEEESSREKGKSCGVLKDSVRSRISSFRGRRDSKNCFPLSPGPSRLIVNPPLGGLGPFFSVEGGILRIGERMGKTQDELKRYNPKLIDHFMNPRNVGDLKDATVRASAENPQCQDLVRYAIRIQRGRIEKIRMKVFGCTVAIAAASAMTELACGRTQEEALRITEEELVASLGGIPKERLRCTTAARAALRKALTS